jgi:hypothetical protein
MLVEAERFPQQPPRAIAHHGAANPAGGNHPQARSRIRRQPLPVSYHATNDQSFPIPPHAKEITPLLNARCAAKPQALWYAVGHGPAVYTGVNRLRPTRRRLRRMPRPLLLELRARNPCCRFRRIFDG